MTVGPIAAVYLLSVLAGAGLLLSVVIIAMFFAGVSKPDLRGKALLIVTAYVGVFLLLGFALALM